MYPQGCGGSSPFFGTSLEVPRLWLGISRADSRFAPLIDSEKLAISGTTLRSLLVGMQPGAVLLFHLLYRKNFASQSGQLRKFFLNFQ